MTYPLNALRSHPGFNLNFLNRLGRGISRWLPHSGAKEQRKNLVKLGRDALSDSPQGFSDDMLTTNVDDIGHAAVANALKVNDLGESLKGPTQDEVADAVERVRNGFQLSRNVTWTSSNTTKAGMIVHVVPAGKLPSDFGVKIKDATTPRDHESYLVRTAPGSKGIFWPRVSLLKLAV